MKYNLHINQKAVIEAGIKGVDAIDLLLFDVLCDAIMHGGLDTDCIDGMQWTWVAYSLMQEELPLLELSTQTFYRRLIKLCDAGLIEKSAANEDARRVYIRLGKRAKLLTSDRHRTAQNEISDPYKLEGGYPYKLEGGIPTNLEGYNTTINNTTIGSREKEAHAQEIAKGEPNPSPQLPKQPDQKTLQPQPPRITTRDIPFCEGHGFKIYANEYPEQSKGVPFCHPSIVLERIPLASRLDLWWRLYGVNVGKGKCEMRLMQANMGDDANFAALYLHTYLYVVANPDKEFRAKPEHYLRDRAWLDDIIDRRKDKPDAPPAAVHDPKDPTNRPRNPEAEARAWERQQAKEADAEWLRKNPPKTN